LQRLPSHRIQRAHELDEVDLQEDPSPAGFRYRNEAALRTGPYFLRMHVQESGGFIKSESPQWGRSRDKPDYQRGVSGHKRPCVVPVV
jgi:hypothetical protein